jgi:hypothetical protein
VWFHRRKGVCWTIVWARMLQCDALSTSLLSLVLLKQHLSLTVASNPV